MDQRDLELIERYSKGDPVLERLYKEHQNFERQIEKLENKSFLTPNEQVEWKDIKKKKLSGKDKIEAILRKYRLAVE